jgi:uncharacterized protein (DUF924 family)
VTHTFPMNTAQDVLEFWFGPRDDAAYGQYRFVWFQPDEAFIAKARDLFSETFQKASGGELDSWQETPEGALALVLLLDQFSNLIHRGEPGAFASDEAAREATKLALQRGYDQEFPELHRWFFYLPLEHSENLDDQRAAVRLFRALPPNDLNAIGVDYAERHLRVIERFGRFPNRNAALGRESTAEEEEFLAGPDAPF